jgi:hypothetical protein
MTANFFPLFMISTFPYTTHIQRGREKRHSSAHSTAQASECERQATIKSTTQLSGSWKQMKLIIEDINGLPINFNYN